IGGHPIDLGASWIHGVDGNPIARIAADNDIQILPTDYDNASTYFHGGVAAHRSRDHVVTGFWSFARQHPRESLRTQFEKFVNVSRLDDDDRRYLAYVLNTAIEHEYAADIGDLSLASISGGEDWPGDDALFPSGYGQITEILSAGLDIRTGQPVTGIDYSETGVVLTTARGEGLEAARVVVTAPLGVLKEGVIAFVPELPAPKRRAIDDLGMGVLNKTCLLFDEVFWSPDVELIGHVGTHPGQWAETVNLFAYTRQPILMMFNAGAYGAQIESMSDSEVVSAALTTLENMYGSLPPLRDTTTTRWQSDPWSFGSYSYVPINVSWADHAELAKPIANQVFFAGEATHKDFPATVHGAYLSGIRAAREVTVHSGIH
ncbi:MAG: FAD-dependent oxidoreductase, partial [Gammaproteobacteria bacterium]|nr:FAD-dependent oxidoreductase [Gammaproteobacteria bacterium]